MTADDFGLLPEVNDAVLAGYDNGVITSAGLRVSATASADAMLAASMRPGLGVGLHLVLCEGQATLPRRHIPNLVNSAGRFPARPLEAAWLYRHRGGLRDELAAEIRAQIEKFLASGLTLTHISGHYHLHLHPTVLAILNELAEEYPILAIRKPCASLLRHDRRPSLPWHQERLEALVLRLMARWGGLRARRYRKPHRVDWLTGSLPATEDEVAARITSVGRGITELVCHPGSLVPALDGTGEAAVVTSPRVAEAIASSGIEMISYEPLRGDFFPERFSVAVEAEPG